ncbi:DNA primase [Arthrobacter phage Atuin]|nr:DNA primase [Arthrobacter phage Atuin]
MKLSDVLGEMEVSSADARLFLQTWFRPDDKICLVGRKSKKVGKYGNTLSQAIIARESVAFTDETLKSLIFSEEAQWNLYFGVGPIKDEVDVELMKRGKEDNVKYLPGVWADIDVKEKGFTSQESILEFLSSLPLQPSIIVGSGSGGVHAYWKLLWSEEGNKELAERWWSYLDEAAGEERKIDKLIDATRILRLPGSVYFPKEGSGGKTATVKLLKCDQIQYSIQQLTELSQAAYDVKNKKRDRVLSEDYNQNLNLDLFARDLLGGMGGNRWKMWKALAELEGYVNEHMTWDEILEPHGWTFLRTLSDDRGREVARPGRNERSGVVDYEDSPVMSLLSESEETGLADLKDARIPLTKFRVYLRLQFNDQREDMARYLKTRLESDGII